jgi:hypothetical protein
MAQHSSEIFSGEPAEDTVTAADVIAEETLKEIEAAAESSKCCTYSLSVPELAPLGVEGIAQVVYSCLTCCEINGIQVGVCEPCVLRCHTDHEVIELGTRRLFRCDCPTPRSSVTCAAQPPIVPRDGESSEVSAESRSLAAGVAGSLFPNNSCNAYGHNFENKFCTCNRVYAAERDELVQCIACDEWYHPVHIPGKLPSGILATCETMVCAKCVDRIPSLKHFTKYPATTCTFQLSGDAAPSARDSVPGTSAEVDPSIVAVPLAQLQPWVACLTCTEGADDGRGVCMACATCCHAGHILSSVRITEFFCDCREMGKCSLPTAPLAIPTAPFCCTHAPGDGADIAHVTNTSLFISSDDGLIDNLCRCSDCMQMYVNQRVSTWFFDSPEPVLTAANTTADELAHNTEALRNASGSPQGRNLLGQLSGAQIASLVPGLPSDFTTSYEQAQRALQALPRSQQIDALHGYQEFSSAFLAWLRQFEGQVVTADAVRQFTQQLQQERRVRQRLE